MSNLIVENRLLRFGLAFLLLAFLAVNFWTTSRYPALDDKAIMGGDIHLEDPLSFEAKYQIEEDYPVWKKIGLTTLNWIETNRKGMTFGILMGAAMLTLLQYLRRVSTKNGFINMLIGLFIGTPMGVCVNCAAPIAKGIYSGGARAETMLAMMISSPTLNIVVVTMALTLLPFYMVVTKLALTFLVILIGVPLICHFLPKSQLNIFENKPEACPIDPVRQPPSPEAPYMALFGVAKDYLLNLWKIIYLTLPLMLLAGFLGSVLGTLVPVQLLSQLQFGILGLLVVAMIGVFLPVPIAFDVVICAALLSSGLDVGYVMVLLFTLGSVSIYSFFITAQSISIRAAAYLAGLIAVLGVLAGFSVSKWHDWETKRALKMLTAERQASDIPSFDQPITLAVLTLEDALPSANGITVSSRPFNARSPAADTLFVRQEAYKIGIDQGIEYSFQDMWPPFWEGRSISTGDVDQDGDLDIVIASTEAGFYLYLNDGHGQFKRGAAAPKAVIDLPVFNAVLVDLNNDGWPDLFLSTYEEGNHILWNEKGRFDARPPQPVRNRDDARLSLALSFGDVDRDGDLDAALGNWTAGWYRRIPGPESTNRIVFNDAGKMDGTHFTELSGVPGETLSILLTDINMDAELDLLVGNDFEPPDIFYLGDGKGGFQRIGNDEGLIPHTTNTTMAIKNQDLDNDLIPEIYLAQIAGRASGISDRLNMQPVAKYCETVTRESDWDICQKNMDIKDWYKAGNNFNPGYADKCMTLKGDYQAECKAMLIKDLAIQSQDESICELIPQSQPRAAAYCAAHFMPVRDVKPEQLDNNYPHVYGRNVLLKRRDDGPYTDASVFAGLEVGGWSWDTKIGDVNNDGWQDIYIVNGTWVPNQVTPSNLYFENNGAGQFSELAEERGLEDFLITAAAGQFDMDDDGDLDFITVPVNGPVQSFINTSQTGNAIKFILQDMQGNRDGIGAKITIAYSDASGTQSQMREIQMGGGFQSFDAPIAHFGLGDVSSVDQVRIQWPDGDVTELDEPLDAGATYTITRDAES